MNSERWLEIEEIFFATTDLAPGERESYLRRACKDDESLYMEVTELLAERDNHLSSFDAPIFDLGMQVLSEEEIANKKSGTTLGRYRIGALIGQGGMGDVYEAEDIELGQKVAVKVINETFALDPERVRRFRREATAVSRISHPNVAKLYGFYTANGENLIAMELVDGVNLRYEMGDNISTERAIDIAIQITSALAAAHEAGVVHRDIKPENIIIASDGTAKVLDFGLAKLIDPISDRTADTNGDGIFKPTIGMSTEHGMLVGTPAYMSPEQIRAAKVDARTDIWSVGVLLYEMLSGQLPFRGPTKIDSIASILMSEPLRLQVDNTRNLDTINAILRKALCKEKEGRYSNACELLIDLQSLKQRVSLSHHVSKQPIAFSTRVLWISLTGFSILIAILLTAFIAFRQPIASESAVSPPSSVLPPITKGLVSYWSADGTTRDIVGGNDGELINGAGFRPGVSGRAFSFDGVDDLFQAPSNGFPTSNADRTIVLWAAVDEFIVEEAPFATYGKPVRGGSVVIATSERRPHFSNWGTAISDAKIEAGRWYQIAATATHGPPGLSTAVLYVNGTPVSDSIFQLETPPRTTFYSGSVPFGLESDPIRKLKGAVDEICVYDRALSAEEIQALYFAVVQP
jgi:serine/threonine protein kinase